MNAPQLAQVAGALIADGKGTLLSCPRSRTSRRRRRPSLRSRASPGLFPALQQAERGGLARKGVQTLDDLERNAILQALAECRGNKKKAAELLGIQRPTLYNKLKRYAIDL